MKILTTAIIKGGTGKTTTAAALAQAAVSVGQRVLAIDLDPQANLTAILGAEDTQNGTLNLLHGDDAENTIQQSQGMDIIAACSDLAAEETKTGSANRLQNAIKPLLSNYDLIMIDTPPQMGELTFNALKTATGLIIPLEADVNSLQGFYQVLDIADHIMQVGGNLKILGAIITRFDGRSNVNKYLLDEIGKELGVYNIDLLGVIRSGIAIKEAQTLKKSLFEYAPKSKPAQDYINLFNTITK